MLEEFEKRYASDAFAAWTYADALEWFAAAWRYALQLNADLGNDWPDDIQSSLAIARVLNGLPERR